MADLLNFYNLNTNMLDNIFEQQKNLILRLNDEIANLDKNNLSWENCFEKPMSDEAKFSTLFSLLDLDLLYPNAEIRTKCTELNKQLSMFQIEQSMRQDVYDVISYYYNNQYVEEQLNLDQEQIKYIENTMIGYKMLGFGLDDVSKERVKEINKQISTWASNYQKNIADVNTSFLFDLNELEGMEDNWLKNRFEPTTSKYVIKLQYPDYMPLIENCKVRETRQKMTDAMGSRCIDTNLNILLDTIKLRKEKAELFGFKSHSDFKLQNMMAKNSSCVMDFLTKLLNMIKPLVHKDKTKLLELSVKDGIRKLENYDKMYYGRLYTEKESGLNMLDLKKMFSVESVTNGIFSIYQELLGLVFKDITNENPNALYSNDIKLFSVYDYEDITFLNPLGYFYLDLFPRDGKYGHAAMFSFVPKSRYTKPISAIVCNFDPKLNLEFDNVVTYFHEFGHLMHNMVSQNNIASLSGTKCQRDFVETPSQMFEEWCYHKEPLRRLVMPEFVDMIDDELVDKINKQKKLMEGIFTATQISYGLLDQAIHSDNLPADTWTFYNNLSVELFDWEISPKVNMLANWSHMYGYDASYYGYLWSKVYAIDLFSFFKSNPIDPVLGKRLRKEILSKGGTLDGIEMLKNFMDREPNPNAFIEWLNE